MPTRQESDAIIDDTLFEASYPTKVDLHRISTASLDAEARTLFSRGPAIADTTAFPPPEASTLLMDRCRQFCLSTFLSEQAPIYTMGITSSISGEGKSFFARMIASVLAADADEAVTLVECNWDHPCLHEHYGIDPTPGLAEWLRGEADAQDISRRIDNNLMVIPCGDGKRDAVRLLRRLQGDRFRVLTSSSKFLIFDLPPITSCAYGRLAASLVEGLVIVVRAGVTPDAVVADTCRQLQEYAVHGVMLNQVKTRIPKWLRKII
jgi:Mrp family chromosome partitioning ATPase